MNNYVYKITNTTNNKSYIGSRSCVIDPSEDLGKEYFSSSTNKSFLKLQKEFPHIFKYEILELFDTYDEAAKYEKLLHRTLNVNKSEDYYNGRCLPSVTLKDKSDKTKKLLDILSNLIRMTRIEYGYTALEISNALDIGRETYRRIESGDATVSIGTYLDVCMILNISIFGDSVDNLASLILRMNNFIPDRITNDIIT